MKIIAYTFEADVHCPTCTKRATRRMKLDHNHPYAMGESFKDDHGIEYDLVDCEGNLVKPVYATDEYEFKVCGDCRVELE